MGGREEWETVSLEMEGATVDMPQDADGKPGAVMTGALASTCIAAVLGVWDECFEWNPAKGVSKMLVMSLWH